MTPIAPIDPCCGRPAVRPNALEDDVEFSLGVGQHQDVSPELGLRRLVARRREEVEVEQHLVCLLKARQPAAQGQHGWAACWTACRDSMAGRHTGRHAGTAQLGGMLGGMQGQHGYVKSSWKHSERRALYKNVKKLLII